MTETNKAVILCKLHEIADHYLVGAGTWPPDRELLGRFWTTVREFGLEEDVPDSPGTTRSTALGNEVNLELMMAFVGAYDLWDIPHILESNGYLTEAEAAELFATPWENEEAELHRYVVRAYLKFCNWSKLLS
jgi:hypothetical protein